MGCCCSKCALPCRRQEDAVGRDAPENAYSAPEGEDGGYYSNIDGRSDRGWLQPAPRPLAPRDWVGGRLPPSSEVYGDDIDDYEMSATVVYGDDDDDYEMSEPAVPIYQNEISNEVYEETRRENIGPQGGVINEDDIRLYIPPDSLRTREDVRVRHWQQSSMYFKMIKNAGLDDILSSFRLLECEPDHLRFQLPAEVTVFHTDVPQSDTFLLFGQETSTAAEVAWKDLSNECSLNRFPSHVSFELQHFSLYILVAVVSSVALSSASKLLLDCLNGKSFPCSFTPYLGKVSGKKHPLTIICKEGYNTATSTPRMYQRFGLARASEFNIFDEEKLSVEIRHISLVKKCEDSYQINRAVCKTEAGQAMDLIVEPETDETLVTGQAVISVLRFLGASVKKICTLNLSLQSPRSKHQETGETLRVSAVEPMTSVPLFATSEGQWTNPTDRHGRKGVRKYFFFIKEKVSSDWKDLAYFLDLDDAGIRNIAGRNPDDKSRCMDMLEDWLSRRGVAATTNVLLGCLSKAGLQDVVDGLEIEFPEVAEMKETN